MEKGTTYLNPHEALTREDKEREINSVLREFSPTAAVSFILLTDDEVNDIHAAFMETSPESLTTAHRLIRRALYEDRHRRIEERGRLYARKRLPFIDSLTEVQASLIVSKYIREHFDESDPDPYFEVYTVWKCKTLQNWKFLISSTLADGMYYEVTYNGDKEEWYLDAYKKFENRCIKKGEE